MKTFEYILSEKIIIYNGYSLWRSVHWTAAWLRFLRVVIWLMFCRFSLQRNGKHHDVLLPRLSTVSRSSEPPLNRWSRIPMTPRVYADMLYILQVTINVIWQTRRSIDRSRKYYMAGKKMLKRSYFN